MCGRSPIALFLSLLCCAGPAACSGGEEDHDQGFVVVTKRGDLYRLRSLSDHASATRLTSTPRAVEYQPRISPDGRQIAFLRRPVPAGPGPSSTPAELWVGSSEEESDGERVTGRPDPSDPAWLPDGRLSFSSRGEIFTVSVDGDRSEHRVADGGCPLWTPDGRAFAVCSARGPGATATVIDLVRKDGSPIRELVSNGGDARPTALTPDGRALAYTDGAGVARLVSLRGGPSRVLMGGAGEHFVDIFLRDGSYVASEALPDRPVRWFRVMPDGERRPLAGLNGVDEPLAVRVVGPAGRASTPAASGPTDEGAEEGGVRRVDGRRTWVRCAGRGSPTVVFVSGLGVESESTWRDVAPAVSRRTRVCEYNRPGVGLTPAVRPPRDAAHMARELAALIDSVAPRGRVVLVGASLGGLVTQIYAGDHPRRIAGMVLVDSLHPRSNALIARAIGPPAQAANRRILSQNIEGARWSDLLASYRQAGAARPFPPVPLIVLKHGISFDPGGRPVPAVERIWGRLQLDLAHRSPRGRLVVARRSHHRIAEDQPRLVAAAVLSVLRRNDRNAGAPNR